MTAHNVRGALTVTDRSDPKFQVFGPVIVTNAVSMVYRLGRSERTSECLFHYETVFRYELTTISETYPRVPVRFHDARPCGVSSVRLRTSNPCFARSSRVRLTVRCAQTGAPRRRFAHRIVVTGADLALGHRRYLPSTVSILNGLESVSPRTTRV